MSPRRRAGWGAVVVAAAAIAILVSPAVAASVAYRDRVREETLSNGLKMILLEDHKAPVGVVQLWYRVGSRNESSGTTGLSHLLEHMMFRGTKKYGPEEYTRIIQRNGGQSNAFTSNDYTTYFATLASDRIGVVLDLEADRMSNLVITEAQFAPERDVVQEERRLRTDDNPTAALFEQLAATAYAAHPYQQPIIGWMSDIARSTADDLLRHYRTYYVPNNAFLVAVGDFDSEKLLAEARRAFGPTPPGAMPPSVRSLEPVQPGERRVEVVREAELPYVAIAYHVPNLNSADAAALEVLAEVLAGGESARLHNKLVYQGRLARRAGASYEYASVDPNVFVFHAQALPGKTAAAIEQALLAEVESCRTRPPAPRELEKAKNGIEAAFVFSQDSLFYQGLLLGQYEMTGDWRRIDDYLPAIRAVTADDLVRVARFYFDESNRNVATLVPLPPKQGRRAPAPMAPGGMGPIH